MSIFLISVFLMLLPGRQRHNVINLSARLSVHLLPTCDHDIFENELTDFDTNWYSWSAEHGVTLWLPNYCQGN